MEPGIQNSLCCCRTEGTDLNFILLEFREVLDQGFNAGGTKEDQQIIVDQRKIRQVAAYVVIQNGPVVFYFVLIQQICKLFMRQIREWQKEFFNTMFTYGINKVIYGPGAKEYFSFSVNDVFLQIKCHCFRNAEIFHGTRRRQVCKAI